MGAIHIDRPAHDDHSHLALSAQGCNLGYGIVQSPDLQHAKR